MRIDYPYLRKTSNDTGTRIEVMADSMRVGKTTAVKVISDGLRKLGKEVTESYEDWQNNPYLKASYEDPARNFLESQKWFAKRKWEQIKDGGKGIFIQDVTPEMDYCYAATNLKLARMSEEHFCQYSEYFHTLDWSKAPAPQLLVYLTVSDNVLLQRAMDSRREFETVEPDYFLMMKKVNRKWLTSNKNDNYIILEIDTDHLDFAHVEKDRDTLISKVINSISK